MANLHLKFRRIQSKIWAQIEKQIRSVPDFGKTRVVDEESVARVGNRLVVKLFTETSAHFSVTCLSEEGLEPAPSEPDPIIVDSMIGVRWGRRITWYKSYAARQSEYQTGHS